MSERLAEIERRHDSTRPALVSSAKRAGSAYAWVTDEVVIAIEQDIPWLLARVRELEAQAARDAEVIEAARAYRIAQQAIASACSPPFDPGVCTDAMVAQDEAEATLDAALAEREE